MRRLYEVFSAQVGVDDRNGSDQGSVEFIVLGDGKELWRSGVLKKSDGAKSVKVNISGVERLVLRVTDGGDGERRLVQHHALEKFRESLAMFFNQLARVRRRYPKRRFVFGQPVAFELDGFPVGITINKKGLAIVSDEHLAVLGELPG